MNPIQTNEYKDEPNYRCTWKLQRTSEQGAKIAKTKKYHEFFNNHYGRVSSSCPANGTRLVTLVGKDIRLVLIPDKLRTNI